MASSEIEKEVMAFVMSDLLSKAEIFGKKASEEIESHFEKFVQSWYDAGPIGSPGNPKYYDRQGDTFYMSSGYDSDAPLYTVTSNNKYIDIKLGIKVDSSRMHYYYKDPSFWVGYRSFWLGIHGTIFTGGNTEPPKSMMDEWFASFCGSGLNSIKATIFN